MAKYTDWKDWARDMRVRSNELRPAFRRATAKATDILHAQAKQNMNEWIYSIPEERRGFQYKRTKEIDEETGLRGYSMTKDGYRKIMMRKTEDGKLVRKEGKKMWTRTGNLRRSERKKQVSDFQGLVHNDANYAVFRHDLGYPEGHPLAIVGSKRLTKREAPFRKRAIEQTQDKRLEVYRKELVAVYQRHRQ